MEHEALLVFALNRVDDLFVAARAQGGDHHRLGFSARKQRRAVRAGQYADTRAYRAHRAGVAPVDSRFAVQYLAAHDARLESETSLLHHIRIRTALGPDADFPEYALPDTVYRRRALLFLTDAESLAQRFLGEFRDAVHQVLVFFGRFPVPGRLGGQVRELVDRPDGGLHLLVPVHDRAQHHLLGQLLRLRFDHEHRMFRTRDNQIELAFLELGGSRIEHVLSVDVTDSRGTDRAVEGNPRNRQCGGNAEHRRDIRIDLGIARHHGRDDLNLVVIAVGKQRPDRPVDKTGYQRVLFRGAPFPLEESAGNPPGRVEFLHVVDREREEILARPGGLGADHGAQDDGVVHGGKHRAVRLTRDLAGFERHLMGAVGKGLRYR